MSERPTSVRWLIAGLVGRWRLWHAGPMTMTETCPSAGSTDPETRKVEEALDALLAANDPKVIDNVAFRGARALRRGPRLGHFPQGFGDQDGAALELEHRFG